METPVAVDGKALRGRNAELRFVRDPRFPDRWAKFFLWVDGSPDAGLRWDLIDREVLPSGWIRASWPKVSKKKSSPGRTCWKVRLTVPDRPKKNTQLAKRC